MLITNTGIIIRTRVEEISVIGRTASGVRVMRTGEDVLVTNFTLVKNDDKETEEIELQEGEEISSESGKDTEETVSEE
jgi:DNA gyrase subunit A